MKNFVDKSTSFFIRKILKKGVVACILLLSLLIYNSSFAQSSNELGSSDTYVKNTSSAIPLTIGLQGFGLFSVGGEINYDHGNGGGVAINFKHSFNKYLGLSFGVSYAYAQHKETGDASYYGQGFYYDYTGQSHLFDGKILFIVQRETEAGKTGFVPYAYLGGSFNTINMNMDISINGLGSDIDNIMNNNTETNYFGAGVGAILGAGVKYNFEKFYVGVAFDYNLACIIGDLSVAVESYGSTTETYSMFPSNMRVYAEVGLRM